MATAYSVFTSTPATVVADIKAKILLSSDWANITGQIVKATTTRGAQMVVDLADATATSNRMQLGVYRTHNGTTGVDKVVRYISYNDQTPATSTILYCTVSAGKEHLFISVEGPRAGETGAQNSSVGSFKQCLALSDLVPYHTADTIPAVVLIGHSGQSIANTEYSCWTNRDQGDALSWVRGYLLTLQVAPPRYNAQSLLISTPQPVAKGDGKTYVWPYVLVEAADGLRGRLAKFFYAGQQYTSNTTADDVPIVPGSKMTYSSEGYTLVTPQRAGANQELDTAFGHSYRANGVSNLATVSPVIAVPNGL